MPMELHLNHPKIFKNKEKVAGKLKRGKMEETLGEENQ